MASLCFWKYKQNKTFIRQKWRGDEMKYAIEFYFTKDDDGNLEYDDYNLIGDDWWLAENFYFEYDYWEWFSDETNTPQLKELQSGKYHVFHYGNVHEEWSENWEYGREFDGLTFEPEHKNIEKIDSYEEPTTSEKTI